MDKLEAMRVFVQIAERGSLSAAARQLNMPLPTLSRKLAELEAELGTRLLARTTRTLALTEAGEGYLAAAQQVLELVNSADRQARSEYVTPKGDLTITAPITMGRIQLLPIVTEFLALYPEVNVKLILADTRQDIVAEHIDVAVRIGLLENNNLVARRMGDLRWVVVASQAFLDAHGTPATPEDVTNMPCVGVDHIHLATTWRFRDPETGLARSVPIRARLAPSTAEVAVDAAVAGVGLTQVLHYQAAHALASGRLCTVLRDFEGEPMPLWLVCRERALLPLKVRTFLDFAAPRLIEAIRFR